jgi:hypothetical protein
MGTVHVIAATRDGTNKEYWAVVGTPTVALTEIRQHLPLGWMVTLTGTSLTPRETAALDMGTDKVRKLRGFDDEEPETS